MNQNELIKINKALAVTAEICGTDLSETAVQVMIKRLSGYAFDSVQNALKKCMDEVTGRLTLAHIKQRLDDGRPSPEIAWSQVPKHEQDSMVMTSEQNQALCCVSAMIDQGELIPARMAFIEKYKQLVAESRSNDLPVSYEMQMGWNEQGRFDAVQVAIQSGMIKKIQAVRLLPEFEHEIMDIPLLESQKDQVKKIQSMASQALSEVL